MPHRLDRPVRNTACAERRRPLAVPELLDVDVPATRRREEDRRVGSRRHRVERDLPKRHRTDVAAVLPLSLSYSEEPGFNTTTQKPGIVALTDPTREAISMFVTGLVERTLRTRVDLEPWDVEAEKLLRPFAFALVPEEVWKGAKFERSFVTSFGSAWEEMALLVARDKYDHAERGERYTGRLHQDQLAQIQRILNELESGLRQPDWNTEFASVLDAKSGVEVDVSVIADLHAWNDEGSHLFFEVKAPKPNSDQTKVSKEKMLKLSAMLETTCAYYTLPYNPYVSREAYAWGSPKRWFDMTSDEVVLIGPDFWDKVGGPGTWDDLMELLEEVGGRLRDRIRREYLGLD